MTFQTPDPSVGRIAGRGSASLTTDAVRAALAATADTPVRQENAAEVAADAARQAAGEAVTALDERLGALEARLGDLAAAVATLSEQRTVGGFPKLQSGEQYEQIAGLLSEANQIITQASARRIGESYLSNTRDYVRPDRLAHRLLLRELFAAGGVRGLLRYREARRTWSSGLFDRNWYSAQRDVDFRCDEHAIADYLFEGGPKGVDPSVFFMTSWYLGKLARGGYRRAGRVRNPIMTYLRDAKHTTCHPFPVFEHHWYIQQYPDVANSPRGPLLHYLQHGLAEGRVGHPLFSRKWYERCHGDVSDSGFEPLVHYLVIGAYEGRDPSPLFSTQWYLERNADLNQFEANPLVHYLMHGSLEGRAPCPLFMPQWYRDTYPDVRESGLDPLTHYLGYGAKEFRNPNPWFDTSWYIAHNQDVSESALGALEHFLLHGGFEGRAPSPRFDCEFYLRDNPDVAAAGHHPLVHFIHYGQFEGRSPLSSDGAGRSDSLLPAAVEPYALSRARNQLSDFGRIAYAELAQQTANLPLLSIVVPVYRPPLDELRVAIESVQNQLYENWQLCLHDDGSDSEPLTRMLEQFAAGDSRIRCSRGRSNGGISDATNRAAALAEGEFIVFLDQDDVLVEDALLHIALAAASASDVDLVYSDDDKLSGVDDHFDPQFKPDFSPTLLLSYMYISHIFCVRRTLFESLGGCRLGFEGSQDFDLALRVAEQVRSARHVPKVLYHWRAVPGSTATGGDAKPASFEAGRRAVAEALERQGLPVPVVQPEWAKAQKIGMFEPEFPDTGERVTLVIPTKDRLELLERCIDSVVQLTRYANYEILIVDNASVEPATLAYFKATPHRVVRVPNPGASFNYAHVVNAGVAAARTPYVLLLNNDTEVVTPQWLSQMMGYVQLPKVGAVGAKLTFPSGQVQHAGIVHGFYDGMAGPAFRGNAADDIGYLGYAGVTREYSAVTAACLLVRRDLYEEIGGLDAEAFAVAYNDVDFCYRLTLAGYRNLYCAGAHLVHAEGSSRGFEDNVAEVDGFRHKYRGYVDPYYNPNLTLAAENFGLRPYVHVAAAATRVPRVLVVTHCLNHEGAPNSQLELVVALQNDAKIDATVLSPFDGPLRSHYEDAGIEVLDLPGALLDTSDAERYRVSIEKLAHLMRYLKIDLVYANTAQTFWAIAAASRAGLPSVWNIRESEPWERYFDFLPAALRRDAYRNFQRAYRVVFVAHATQRAWQAVDTSGNFTTIHNALDRERLESRMTSSRSAVRSELGLADTDVLYLLLGTVCDRKNQRLLLDALAQMEPSELETAVFYVVGDRPSKYSEFLHERRADLPSKLAARVHFIAETGKPYEFFAAADVFLCTSKIESYPRVILEALQFGLPIITTPVFGIPEQVTRGYNAEFCEPDDPEAMATAIRALLDPELRAEYAEHSAARFATLPDFATQRGRYLELFRQAAWSGVLAEVE